MSDWTLDPAILTLDVVLINLAYVILITGTCCRSVHGVRAFLVLGATCFAVYGALADIPSMIVWNSVIGGLNLRRLAIGLRDRLKAGVATEPPAIETVPFEAPQPVET